MRLSQGLTFLLGISEFPTRQVRPPYEKAVEGGGGSPGTARPTGRSGESAASPRWPRRGAALPPPPRWRRSQLSPSYPFAEEWVFKKVFAVEFVDYLVGYEALERLGDAADIPYPVGLHELAGKHLGMVGFGNPL